MIKSEVVCLIALGSVVAAFTRRKDSFDYRQATMSGLFAVMGIVNAIIHATQKAAATP